jgi:hypothetical protein
MKIVLEIAKKANDILLYAGQPRVGLMDLACALICLTVVMLGPGPRSRSFLNVNKPSARSGGQDEFVRHCNYNYMISSPYAVDSRGNRANTRKA